MCELILGDDLMMDVEKVNLTMLYIDTSCSLVVYVNI